MNKRRISLFSVPIVLLLLATMVMALPAGADVTGTMTLTAGHGIDAVDDELFVSTAADEVVAGANIIDIQVNDADFATGGPDDGGAGDEITVNASSSTDSTGIPVTLTEDMDTGVFNGSVTLIQPVEEGEPDPAPGELEVNDGDTVTVRYQDNTSVFGQQLDVTEQAFVDNNAPTFSTFSPEDEEVFGGSSELVTIEIVAVDDNAGFIPNDDDDEATQNVTFMVDGPGEFPAEEAEVDDNGALIASFDENFPAGTWEWNATVTDRAGNETTLDVDDGDNPTFTVDNQNPEMDAATTGEWYSSGQGEIIQDDRAVRVDFNENSGMDAATIGASDFNVDGDTPTSAVVHNVSVDGDDLSNSVFLRLANPLDPDATPEVNLVGDVRDLAGNRAQFDTIEADDGINPGLEVAITGEEHSRPVSSDEITVRIVANEPLLGAPRVLAQTLILADVDDDGDEEDPDLEVTAGTTPVDNAASTVSGATRTWEFTLRRSQVGEGLINVFVTGRDRAQNTTMEGVDGFEAILDLDDALLVEFDNTFNGDEDPTIRLNPEASEADQTDSLTPVIEVQFEGEANEYTISGEGESLDRVPSQQFGNTGNAVDVDAHEGVTITEATFGAEGETPEDVTDDVRQTDPGVFFFMANRVLEVGTTYIFTVTGEDLVGNEASDDATFEFTVVGPQEYEVDLLPGWNLLSFPATPRDLSDPADPSVATVNDVFGEVDGVDMVMTYDRTAGPELGGPWLVAQRGEDGTFSEDQLVNLDSRRAYWVQSTGFETVGAVIPRRAVGVDTGGLQPPQIGVREGWNLVGVLDSMIRERGTEIAADDYFDTTEWAFAYTFNTATGLWERVSPDEDEMVQVGHGYWLWVTEDGLLVP